MTNLPLLGPAHPDTPEYRRSRSGFNDVLAPGRCFRIVFRDIQHSELNLNRQLPGASMIKAQSGFKSWFLVLGLGGLA